MYDAIFLKLPRLDIVFFNGSILKVIQCYVWVAREGRPNFFVDGGLFLIDFIIFMQ